ncbi:MAG: hypothetical protein ABFS16_02665 [Bacteroidota bacterium]
MKLILSAILFISMVFPSLSQDSLNNIQLKDEKISLMKIQESVSDMTELNWREVVKAEFNQSDSNNQEKLTEEDIEKWARLMKTVDEQFFDYNYISAFNTKLEEIALEEINRLGKDAYESKSTLKSGTELYSPFIKEIRDYYKANRNIWKHIEKKYGLPMWDRLLEMKLENGKLAVIPVASLNSIYVEAIIYVFKDKNDILNFHYAERGNFEEYPLKYAKINVRRSMDREFILSQFLLFDKTIFQYSGCDIMDEYKEQLKQGTNLKSTSSMKCIYDSYLIETLYYEVCINGEVAKRIYSYSDYIYDVEQY